MAIDLIRTAEQRAATGADSILGLGATTAHASTTITLGPEIYSQMARAGEPPVSPQVGDVLIAWVQAPAEWVPPSGWTVNGECAHRTLTAATDFSATWTFTLLEAGDVRVHVALARPLADGAAS